VPAQWPPEFSRPRSGGPHAEVPTTSRWTVHGHAPASLVDQPPRVLWVLVIAVVLLDAGARTAPPEGRFLRRSPSVVRGLFRGQLSGLLDALWVIKRLKASKLRCDMPNSM
jgi:hypothetical protein